MAGVEGIRVSQPDESVRPSKPHTRDGGDNGGDGAGEGPVPPDDAGAYLGTGRELAAESIPGGVRSGDERVAGEATESAGTANAGANPDDGWREPPEGHREGEPAGDNAVRRAGENR